jgi:hypothetical protein
MGKLEIQREFLVGKTEEKRPLVRSARRLKDYSEKDIGEIECEVVCCHS